MLPDRVACLGLLKEAGCSQRLVEHAECVARLALAMAGRAPRVDRSVVEAGALLHDVGRAFEHGLTHVPLGVAFLERHRVDERVVRCVARHLGAGVTPEEARALGWPSGRYSPETLEERIVCHADNLTFGNRYGTLAEVLDKMRRQGLTEQLERMRLLHDGLTRELGVDPDEIARCLA